MRKNTATENNPNNNKLLYRIHRFKPGGQWCCGYFVTDYYETKEEAFRVAAELKKKNTTEQFFELREYCENDMFGKIITDFTLEEPVKKKKKKKKKKKEIGWIQD